MSGDVRMMEPRGVHIGFGTGFRTSCCILWRKLAVTDENNVVCIIILQQVDTNLGRIVPMLLS